jgi:mRNA interferase RelE/StbE
MRKYSITFARPARKELESLDGVIVRQIFPRIESLTSNPRPRGCRKLRGEKNIWRIRVGDYRVIYAVHDADKSVDIIAVRHRRNAYQ